MDQLELIPLSDIWADEEWNVRGTITPGSVAGLAADIEINGQLQPIRVMKKINEERGTKFKCILGHRRYAAFELLARTNPDKYGKIECRIEDREITDAEALMMNLKENLERVDLNMLQEAKGIERFKKHFKWDTKRVAQELGQTKKWVEVRFALLLLPQEIQNRAAAGYLNQYQVEECYNIENAEKRLEYVRRIVDYKERGKKIPTEEKKSQQRQKLALSIMARGEPRSVAEMALVQESIQDSFDDRRHPAAMSLAWAMGLISYDEFIEQHVKRWVEDHNAEYNSNIEFKHHAEIVKRQEEAS